MSEMRDELKALLDPADDGRGFTDAVLLEAAGALARRRAAADAAGESPWAWLERWARPWVFGALAAAAIVALLPALQESPAGVAAADEPAEVFLASPQPDVTLTVAWGR